MPELTHEEARMARELWDLRSSEEFLDGKADAVAQVRRLEARLADSVEANKFPEERYAESVERLSQEE